MLTPNIYKPFIIMRNNCISCFLAVCCASAIAGIVGSVSSLEVNEGFVRPAEGKPMVFIFIFETL